MTAEKIKPCPFCGSHVINIIGSGDMARYECDGCSASAPYCDWNDRAAENELETELNQARAAAVQWVTYDGTPETLPEISLGAVIINVRRKYTGYIPLFIYRVAICVNNNWDSAHALPLPVEIGDHWAYLPEPPVVME